MINNASHGIIQQISWQGMYQIIPKYGKLCSKQWQNIAKIAKSEGNDVANIDKLYEYFGKNVSNNSLVTYSILALPCQKFPGKNLPPESC